MNLEQYDRIIITEDQEEQISDWFDNNYGPQINLPFEEGVIIYKNYKLDNNNSLYDSIHYFKKMTDTDTFHSFKTSDEILEIEFISVVSNDEYKIGLHDDRNYPFSPEKKHGFADSCFQRFNAVMRFISNYERNKEYVQKQRVPYIKQKTKKGKKKYKTAHVITLNKKMNLYINEKENIHERIYERHTESWGVRGHWRTIGNKKVWVRPYVKGSGKIEHKTYVID